MERRAPPRRSCAPWIRPRSPGSIITTAPSTRNGSTATRTARSSGRSCGKPLKRFSRSWRPAAEGRSDRIVIRRGAAGAAHIETSSRTGRDDEDNSARFQRHQSICYRRSVTRPVSEVRVPSSSPALLLGPAFPPLLRPHLLLLQLPEELFPRFLQLSELIQQCLGLRRRRLRRRCTRCRPPRSRRRRAPRGGPALRRCPVRRRPALCACLPRVDPPLGVRGRVALSSGRRCPRRGGRASW